MYLLTLLGIIARGCEAWRNALNPDEVLIALIAAPAGWFEQSFEHHHPPFFYFFHHWVQQFSQAELALRIVPLFAGSLYPLVVAAWLGRLGLRQAGLFAFALLQFSPRLIALSVEGRGYTLCLLLVAGALYWLERSIASERFTHLVGFAACLYGAILTEYMAIHAAFGLGLYGLFRLWGRSRPLFFGWMGVQVVGILIYGWLYVSSVQTLLGRGDIDYYVTGYLAKQFPQPGQSLLPFVVRNSASQFSNLGYTKVIGFVLALLAGIGLLRKESRPFGTAVILTFGFALALAIGKIHPFGNSRHSVVFAIFCAALAGIGMQEVARRVKWLRLHWVALVIVMGMLAKYAEVRAIDKGLLAHSLQQNLDAIPDGVRAVLVEEETALLLRYYFAGRGAPASPVVKLRAFEWADGRRFAWYRWLHKTEETIREDAKRLRSDLGMTADSPVWVLDSGFAVSEASQKLAGRRGGVVGFPAP